MPLDHTELGHKAQALEGVWNSPSVSAAPPLAADAAHGNAPVTVFREIAAVLAATLAFVAAADLALTAFGIR